MMCLKMTGCKTFKELEPYLYGKGYEMTIFINSSNDPNIRLRVETLLPFIDRDYYFTYQKNSRGKGYYLYDDWIYTEEEMVKIILDDLNLAD